MGGLHDQRTGGGSGDRLGAGGLVEPPAGGRRVRAESPDASPRLLADLLTIYQDAAAATDALVETVDLESDHALPDAPWFEQGAR